MNDLVSLVMPVWRPRRDWLTQAVRSALGQRGCTIELIVVDDGNAKPVAAQLRDVADRRLRVVATEHGGPSHARNVGIEAATGRFIRFIDADDVYAPRSTERMVKLIGDDSVIAYGRTVFCDEDLRTVWTLSIQLEGWIAPQAVLNRFRVRPQSLLFPADIVHAAGPWDTSLSVCEDLEFMTRALEHAPVRPDPGVATYYRKHRSSTSSDLVRADEGLERVLAGYLERHPGQRGTSFERRAVASRHAVAARARATRGMPGHAAGRLTRSLALDPREAAIEAWAALPAVRGHLVHALRRTAERGRRR